MDVCHAQKEAADASHGMKEELEVDCIANPHTPLTNVSEAFYKCILGTYGYIITSILQRPCRHFTCMMKLLHQRGLMR